MVVAVKDGSNRFGVLEVPSKILKAVSKDREKMVELKKKLVKEAAE